ncbi:MAG: T9SS type A sorting domain-containing protein [Chlorobiota bacterium]
MKTLLIAFLFFSTNYLFSQNDDKPQSLVDISIQLNLEEETVFLDTSKVELEYFLNTYNPEQHYNALYVSGTWSISTLEPMFEYSNLVWDEELTLNSVRQNYSSLINDLVELNSSLKVRTKYRNSFDVNADETNFLLSFIDLVNVEKVNEILNKYESRSLFYIFHSPINIKTMVPNDRTLDPTTNNYNDIHYNHTGSFYTKSFHERGWAWEHYSIKTPLSWEFSSGKKNITIVDVDDTSPIISQKSRYTDVVENTSSTGSGNWNVYSSTLGNLGDTPGSFTTYGLQGDHAIAVLPKAIAKGDNDNLLSTPNNPTGGLIGSCFDCSGILISSPSNFEILDTDFLNDGNTERVRVACRPYTSNSASLVQFQKGIIWVSGNGNNLTPGCNDSVVGGSYGIRNVSGNTWTYNTKANGSTQTIFPGSTPDKDFKGLTIAALSDGILYNEDCLLWSDPSTPYVEPSHRGRERFYSGWMFSPGTDKFNNNPDDSTRAAIKRQASVDVLGPSIAITDMTTNVDMVININGSGVSQGQPFIAGVAGLMTSINDYMGVPLDANGHPIVGEDVQRKFYDIVTFTADKIIDDGDTPDPYYCGDKLIVTESPTQPEYLEQSNDKLKRWWAQRCGFGKVNAYRSMAHTIENKADYTIDGTYTLPFADDNGSGDSRGYVNPDGNQLLHMGSWTDDNSSPEFYEVSLARGPTTGDDDPWQVLEWGGASNPMHPEAYNNYGVTLLEDVNSRIELTVGASGTVGNRKNQLLAIDGNLIGIPSWANHKIVTDVANDEGIILIQGYIKDVEVVGELRVGDLDIDATSGGVGCLWFGGAPSESEIYGVVTTYNNGMLFGGGGITTMQPGAHIRVAGDNDIALRFDSEWHMKGGSKISAVDISYDSDNFDIETPNTRKLVVEGGSKLYIDEGHKVELDIEVEVMPCGELIVEKDALLRIKKLKVHKGGTFTVDEGAKVTFDSPYNELLGTNDLTGTSLNPITLRAETFRDCKYDNDNVIGSSTIDVCFSFPYSTPEVITQNITFNSLSCDYSCPVDNSWFVLTKEKPGSCPDSTDCEITHSLNIPDEYTCSNLYSHYKVETILNGSSSSTSVLPYSNESQLPGINICIGENDVYIVKIYLYKSISDQNPCVLEQSITCDCDCPDEAEDWLTVTSEKGGSNCAVNQCYVSHDLDVNLDSYPCYTHVEISSEVDEETIITPTVVSLSNLDLSTYNLCINEGESYTFTIKLMRGTNDTIPCVIERTVFCELESSLEPCKPDCFDDDFIEMPSILFELKSCPGCYVKVNYSQRIACGVWQDIQITSIERFELPNTGTWSNCSLCSDAEVYRLSIIEIIDRNKMGFEPKDAGDGCSDIWRVSKSSCWAQWTRLIMNPVTEEVRTIELNKPCNSNCCLRRMMVCYNDDDTKTITDLGTSGNSSICDSLTYQTTYPPIENIDCEYTCDMLDEINDVVSKSIYMENVEAVEYTKVNSNDIVFEYNLNQSSNRIDVNISETNVERLKIRLYDFNGKPVIQSISNDISNNSFISLDISELVTGTYFISFELNGLEFKSDKFIVVK